MKIWIAGFLFMAMALSGVGCAQAQESSLVGKKAPDFTLERLKGKSASLTEVIQGKKAILFFFATWCPHCREQLKVISAKKEELLRQGIEVVLIDIGESRAAIDRFVKVLGVELDVFMDVESFVAETYEVAGVPMLFLVGVDGKVRYVEFGLPDNYQEILK